MFRLLAFLVILFIALPCAADQPAIVISTMSPIVGFPPLFVRMRTALKSDAHNRVLCLSWVGPNASGSGCQDVDGDRAPLTFWRDITLRRGGDYQVAATIARDDGKQLMSNILVVRVLSPGQEQE